MIIESPHIKDFKGDNTTCSANGKTGEKIRIWINKINVIIMV